MSKVVTLLTGRASAWVARAGLLLAVALIGAVGQAETPSGRLDAAPVGADSTEGTRLQAEIPDGEDSVAVVLATTEDGGQLSKAQVGGVVQAIQRLGSQEVTPLGPPVVRSEDGTATITPVAVPQLGNEANGDFIEELRGDLTQAAPEGVEVQVTGPAAVLADLSSVFDGASLRLLVVTASVVAVLLIITYRSPVLWLVPVVVIGLADQLAATLAPQVLRLFDVPWDGSTTGILSVLVFGAGTDYALLLISRYRDELRVHEDRHEAMATALGPTAGAAIPSAFTVFLGLISLVLSVIPTTRGLGLACAIGILIGASFVLLVLPGTLVLFGRWIFWPQVPRTSLGPVDRSRSIWARIGRRVAGRPLGSPAASWPSSCCQPGRPPHRHRPGPVGPVPGDPRVDHGVGPDRGVLPRGTVYPVRVVTRADRERVARTAAEVDDVASARPSASGNGVSQVDVVLTTTERADSEQAVEALRYALASYDDTHATGTVATALDSEQAAQRDQWLIIPMILVLVLIGLVLLLRSVLAPLLLVASVVLTYGAALGIAWFAYTQIFGFGAMDSTVPLFAFLFLVALGVDYNIFLVTRAAEETPEHGTRVGMLRALASTGGVITSAGVLLAAVFASLGVLPLVVLAQLGIVIFIGVLLDTLLVRTILVPALAEWLGDRFWWPRRFPPAPGADSSAASSTTVGAAAP